MSRSQYWGSPIMARGKHVERSAPAGEGGAMRLKARGSTRASRSPRRLSLGSPACIIGTTIRFSIRGRHGGTLRTEEEAHARHRARWRAVHAASEAHSGRYDAECGAAQLARSPFPDEGHAPGDLGRELALLHDRYEPGHARYLRFHRPEARKLRHPLPQLQGSQGADVLG